MTRYTDELASLPATWGLKSLSDIASVFGGSTPSREVSRFWNGNIPWVTPGEVTSLPTPELRHTREQITPEGLSSCGTVVLPAGALIVTTRATLGAVALLTSPTATNQGFKSLVFRSADPRFYYYILGRMRGELERLASGTTFLEISARDFSAIRVPEPPLAEQSAIRGILDAVDQQVQQTEQLVAKLKLVKQGLLHDLLTRGIDDNGELRDPDRHPEQFKDSPLGRIPQEWKAVTLEQVIDPLRPVVYGILMPGQGFPDGVPVVKVKDIYGGQINTAELLLTSPAIDHEYRRSRLCEGDLLFTIRGTVGRTAFVPPELAGANITQDTARLAIKGACPPFVQSYLDMPKPRRFVENHTIGVAVRGINLRDVRKIPVAHPPLREAAAIATRISTADKVIRQERVRTSKLRLLKQALMDDLLTGRIRVTPLL